MYEIDLETGEIIRFLDYKRVMQRGRYYGDSFTREDWTHINSVVEDDDGFLIVSSNYQSTVIKNNWAGEIKWMLADPTEYHAYWQQFILNPVGEDFEYPYNQHAAKILPDSDHNPDTLDIILFDNGRVRNLVNSELQRQIRANEIVEPPLYSRIVIYRINERAMTVEQLWQWGKERPDLYAGWVGNAILLPNGNRLGLFQPDNSLSTHVMVEEVAENGDLIWECYLANTSLDNRMYGYRAERFEIYQETANDLKIGMPAGIFLPENMLDLFQAMQEEGNE